MYTSLPGAHCPLPSCALNLVSCAFCLLCLSLPLIFTTMTNKTVFRSFLPLLLMFIITNALFLTASARFAAWNLSSDVLITGNLILFVATALSFYLYIRSLQTKNAQAIVRTVYSGVLVKMMICLIAVFIYISITRKAANKGAIIGCMILYLLYTFGEVAILMKLSKQNKNV